MSLRHRTARGGSTATDDFITSLGDMFRAALAVDPDCPWCGIDHRDATRSDHERLHRQSETTWRKAAA